MQISDILTRAPVIPVLVLHDPADARSIAEALVAGGVVSLEVTLRTPAALECIEEMRNVDGAVVGAGTVLNETDLDSALRAGASFVVSPGLTERLAAAAIERHIPFLPGVANASDVMRGLEFGLDHFKFFPAEANGGVPALRALSGPFWSVRFCPTGGITPANAPQWLGLPNVVCVGGTWLSPNADLDLVALRKAAEAASRLSATASSV